MKFMAFKYTMSNPWMPPKEPVVSTPYDDVPDAFFSKTPTEWKKEAKISGNLEHIKQMLDGLDMEESESFYIEKRFCIDDTVRKTPGKVFALAKSGGVTARLRTSEAHQFAGVVLRELPEYADYTPDYRTNGFYPLGRVAAQHALRSTFLIGGGSELSLGRMKEYYPKKGRPDEVDLPTPEEVQRAMASCGLLLAPDKIPRVATYVETEGLNPVTVNPNGENGFPMLGKWKDEGAASMALTLAKAVDRELKGAWDTGREGGVDRRLGKMERERPWIMAMKGKAKTDCYKEEKLWEFKLRFYNVVPRPLMLIMQRVTQPYEQAAGTFLDGYSSFQGCSLAHGGADDVVTEWDRRLLTDNFVWITCGDDTGVAVKTDDGVTMFSVDCSSFDLTQRGDVTEHIHDQLYTEMAKLMSDEGGLAQRSARLWHRLMRRRIVVVAKSVAKVLKSGGASGMPCQPKVNSVLMEVYLHRLKKVMTVDNDVLRFTRGDYDRLNTVVEVVGNSLGLKVRLEDAQFVPDVFSVRDFLAQQPFKFVGYLFHGMASDQTDETTPKVDVCIDLARQLGQVRYPHYLWVKDKLPRMRREAIRIGSIVLGWGIPPAPLQAAFTEARWYAIRLLEKALLETVIPGEEEDAWSYSTMAFAPLERLSAAGLLAALKRPEHHIWREDGNGGLPYTSGSTGPPSEDLDLSESPPLGNWADEMDEVEPQRLEPPTLPLKLPPMAPIDRAHPPTAANAGRPPPVSRWGPPREPQPKKPMDESGASTSAPPPRGGRASRSRNRKGPKGALVPDDDDFAAFDDETREERAHDEELEEEFMEKRFR